MADLETRRTQHIAGARTADLAHVADTPTRTERDDRMSAAAQRGRAQSEYLFVVKGGD